MHRGACVTVLLLVLVLVTCRRATGSSRWRTWRVAPSPSRTAVCSVRCTARRSLTFLNRRSSVSLRFSNPTPFPAPCAFSRCWLGSTSAAAPTYPRPLPSISIAFLFGEVETLADEIMHDDRHAYDQGSPRRRRWPDRHSPDHGRRADVRPPPPRRPGGYHLPRCVRSYPFFPAVSNCQRI